jgi:tRNA nucleotidyltransferase (CCA-adding enzyme)
MTTVRDIMSFGALSVRPNQPLSELIGRLRRVGHEGYPVVEDGQILGLLTSRDLNRADVNNLTHLQVRDVMTTGNIQVAPDASVRRLPILMEESGWGQIPVVEHNVMIGIVTRTDVIRFYAHAESQSRVERTVTHEEVISVLGEAIAGLIAFIARQAASQGHTIYMVGGVVRDLLLKRPNTDIDFVLEGNAIPFAEWLTETYGGELETHEAFGTAKWILDDVVANAIGQPLSVLPAYIDLVTARHEFYEEPAILPTVYTGGIKLDLRRRDFTVNALAIRLRAEDAGGTVIDLFGGLSDLEDGLIRALHSLSFSDDPTRTLRAVRFAHRLGFEIEERTAALIHTALPMMARITGERLKNELILLFKEPLPEVALLRLQEMGVLQAIHPQFVVDDRITEKFERRQQVTLDDIDVGNPELYPWLVMALAMDRDAIQPIGKRLLLRKSSIQAMVDTASLAANLNAVLDGKPSEITKRLDMLSLQAIVAVAQCAADQAQRKTLLTYLHDWRHVQPQTTGNTLKAMGLEPGPQFRVILNQLRIARLDGLVDSATSEKAYVAQLIEERNRPS